MVDNHRTITVIWEFTEGMCQPPCQVAVYVAFHSFSLQYYGWFSMRKQGSEEGSSLPQVPWPQFAETDFVWSFCASLWYCYFLSGSGTRPANHFLLRTSTVQPLLLFLSPSHDVKEEKMILGTIFNHSKQMYKCLPHCAPWWRVTDVLGRYVCSIFTWSSRAGWCYSLFLDMLIQPLNCSKYVALLNLLL